MAAVGEESLTALLKERFGVVGTLHNLGSQQDLNHRVRTGDGGDHVLKIANPVTRPADLDRQVRAIEALSAAAPDLRLPRAHRGTDGAFVQRVTVDGTELHARLLDHVPGEPIMDSRYLAPEVVAALGTLSGRVAAGLAGLGTVEGEGFRQWDLRNGLAVVETLAPYLADRTAADRVRAAARAADDRLEPYVARLPVQTIHGDVTDNNVVCEPGPDGRPRPVGVIDFGDLGAGWAVAELAVTCTSVLHHHGSGPASVLPAVRAFHAVRPLSADEADALWPLIVLRCAVLVVSGRYDVLQDPGNDYATAALDREWAMLESALSVPTEVMTAAVRAATGHPAPPGPPAARHSLLPAPDGPVDLLDLSVLSDALHDGAWLDPDAEEISAARALESGAAAVLTRHGEHRLTRSRPDDPSAATAALGVEVWTAHRTTLTAPWDGELTRHARGGVTLSAEGWHLVIDGVYGGDGDGLAGDGVDGAHRLAGDGVDGTERLAGDGVDNAHRLTDDGIDGTHRPAPEDRAEPVRAGASIGVRAPEPIRVRAGEPIGVLAPRTAAHILLTRLDAPAAAPRFAGPALAAGWLACCPDPTGLLLTAGTREPATGDGSPARLLTRRDRSFAAVQEHYYDAPPRIERGWRQYLVDTEGRCYLDMLNNVTILGHGHPRLSTAVHRQWQRLNTNSRFHYASVVELSERLAELLPAGLDQVFLVNSGSEAVDLALRLAWAATGRQDTLAIGEAYHGWTYASDAVSTSIADNPGALTSRPDWVYALPAPNTYRGTHRGAEAGRYGTEAVAAIEELAASGRPPGAFICEPYYGNAGGMALPDGYLEQVYAAVRAAGGLCVADEVQVGYGRLGDHFWGFEQQGVVPDIVTVAKAMGNGHPLGAVVTTPEIAAAYRTQGYFFSSAGGSPVSSVVGLTVLDAIRDERLQDNARTVGDRLRSGLLELAGRHPLIGAVHGSGLYLGVELVRDRATLEPAAEETAAICERLRELGVIVQPTSDRQCVLKIKPPLCLTPDSADRFVAALDDALTHGW
ncbi:aminotransferase class III-fold pyridoxal phosphate-dependent enzyme [Streptomyces sp. NPDC004610]|uniref:aminotransferase class III-fold pyridoxal phosphate-dependent enzyme n=1 Tax=unclassified Streptomyces TaxID=2593676 RepID=UPI0033B35A9C